MHRLGIAFVALVSLAPLAAAAQAPRAVLTGPFVQMGLVAGSVTKDSDPIDKNHTGTGWGAGAGLDLSRWFTVLAEYSIYRVENDAPHRYNLEQSAIGIRLRVGGEQTPVVFYVEGGGAIRRATLSPVEVYGNDPPSSNDVDVDGWSGWFGPGAQFYVFGPRVPLDLSVAWAWGRLRRGHVEGTTFTLANPIGITTLRLRVGIAAALF